MQSVLGIFELGAAERLPLRVRIEAAEALGRAGHTRLLQEHWIEIPACSFMMGEGDDAHKVELSAYRIGRYPVTVQEYAKFMEAGGYEDERWWAAGKSGAEKAPRGWHEQRTHPNRPVVGVNWYEAAAYCAWRGRHLPTEAQWERAAGGTEGRIYPWGDEGPDVTRANYHKPGSTRPRRWDCFRAGARRRVSTIWRVTSGSGCWKTTTAPKALRGGSWGINARVVRVSYRVRNRPGYRDDTSASGAWGSDFPLFFFLFPLPERSSGPKIFSPSGVRAELFAQLLQFLKRRRPVRPQQPRRSPVRWIFAPQRGHGCP